MTDRAKDKIIEGHEADGIREYDNPMPRWWLTTFYVTILFSVFYFAYLHLGGGGLTVAQEFVADELHAKALEPPEAMAKMEATEEELAAALAAPAQKDAGKGVYAARCQSCHGPEGQGLVGPNLTDDHFIHGGGTLGGLFQVVRDGGRQGKGMIAWSTQLGRDEIVNVVAFVASLHGTQPPNPKAAEGDKVDRVSWK